MLIKTLLLLSIFNCYLFGSDDIIKDDDYIPILREIKMDTENPKVLIESKKDSLLNENEKEFITHMERAYLQESHSLIAFGTLYHHN